MARHVSTAQFKHSDRPLQYSCTRVPLTTHSHFPALDQTYQNQSVLRPPHSVPHSVRARGAPHLALPCPLEKRKARRSRESRVQRSLVPPPSITPHTDTHLKRINSYRYRKIIRLLTGPLLDRPLDVPTYCISQVDARALPILLRAALLLCLARRTLHKLRLLGASQRRPRAGCRVQRAAQALHERRAAPAGGGAARFGAAR